MTEKHEVEYRAIVSREVFDELCRRGKKSFPASFQGPLIIEDAYFCPKEMKNFKETEMNRVGSYGLRLRRETFAGKIKTSLNAKILTQQEDHTTGLEHEVLVSSPEECRGVLELIGFKVFFEYKKHRYTYLDGEIRVCLENVEKFHPTIEVEIITSREKIPESRKKLLSFLDQYDIPRTSLVEKSITNMLMHERSFF